jgi:hypothetical protein
MQHNHILVKPIKNKRKLKKKKLAQLVEHPFYTRQVKCSNHLFLTTYQKKSKYRDLAVWYLDNSKYRTVLFPFILFTMY